MFQETDQELLTEIFGELRRSRRWRGRRRKQNDRVEEGKDEVGKRGDGLEGEFRGGLKGKIEPESGKEEVEEEEKFSDASRIEGDMKERTGQLKSMGKLRGRYQSIKVLVKDRPWSSSRAQRVNRG